jgi:transcriptional regulator with XRE-family HTH domain
MQQLTHQQLLKALQQLIKEKGITQTELAKRTGFHQGNISRIFEAKYAPGLNHFLALVNASGISLAELEKLAVTIPPPVE